MAALSGPVSPGFTLATPDKGCRLAVPGFGSSFKPKDDVLGLGRVLTCKRPANEDTLDRLSHIQPTPTNRRVNGHDAVLHQPADQFGGLMSGKVVQHQEHSEGRRVSEQGEPDLQTLLPTPPGGAAEVGVKCRRGRQGCQDCAQLLFKPGMENGILGTGHALDPDLTRSGLEKGQKFGGASAEVFMRLAHRLAQGLPTLARLRNGLVRTSLILTPECQTQTFGT